MLYLLGLFAVILVGGTMLIRVTILLMTRKAGKFLSETHTALEFIHKTGTVPPQWLARFQANMQQLRQDDPQYQPLLAKNANAARKHCLRKLQKLHKYVDRSSLVENEETRMILLDKLSKVREKWMEQDWSKLLVP